MIYKRRIVETSLKGPECHLSDCNTNAVYEGWAKVVDPLIGWTVGRNVFIPVCEEHKMSLIGFQKREQPKRDRMR